MQWTSTPLSSKTARQTTRVCWTIIPSRRIKHLTIPNYNSCLNDSIVESTSLQCIAGGMSSADFDSVMAPLFLTPQGQCWLCRFLYTPRWFSCTILCLSCQKENESCPGDNFDMIMVDNEIQIQSKLEVVTRVEFDPRSVRQLLAWWLFYSLLLLLFEFILLLLIQVSPPSQIQCLLALHILQEFKDVCQLSITLFSDEF